MYKLKKQITGFTLIELLVVIAIIGLLASVVLVASNSSRAKARNARRLADIKQLVSAFNLGFDANGFLPSSGGNWVCVASSCYSGWSPWPANGTVDAFLAPYIKKPSDPQGGVRGAGGFLYINVWTGGAGFSGTFPAGAYLNADLEAPYTESSCGSGKAWAVNANEVNCLFKLD